jgi:hypothetical protein
MLRAICRLLAEQDWGWQRVKQGRLEELLLLAVQWQLWASRWESNSAGGKGLDDLMLQRD